MKMSPEQADEVMLQIPTRDANEPDLDPNDPNDPDADAPNSLKLQLNKSLDVMQQGSEKNAATWGWNAGTLATL